MNPTVLGMKPVSVSQSCLHASEMLRNKPEAMQHETAGKLLEGQAQVSSGLEQWLPVSGQAPAWQQQLN